MSALEIPTPSNDRIASIIERYATVILRAGVNLQRGQRLVIADPYVHQGVPQQASALVDALTAQAMQLGASGVEILRADPSLDVSQPSPEFRRHMARQNRFLMEATERGDALVFLQDGANHTETPHRQDSAEARVIAWTHFGPVASRLVQHATNWTAAPCPTPSWAAAVFPDLAGDKQLTALWNVIASTCHLEAENPSALWLANAEYLDACAGALNNRRILEVRLQGDGVDLRLRLPPRHRWITARGKTARGVSYLANLPTREVFTLPHRLHVAGRLRCERPVVLAQGLVGNLRLSFEKGIITGLEADTGVELLRHFIATDEGAKRLGEIAVIPEILPEDALPEVRRPDFNRAPWPSIPLLHPVLDENASPHVALGEPYPLCLEEGDSMSQRERQAAGCNNSFLHLDLPIACTRISWL